jgi:hypothetical protein
LSGVSSVAVDGPPQVDTDGAVVRANLVAEARPLTTLLNDRRPTGVRARRRARKVVLVFVSDEHNGVNQDNKGTVRPRHVRNFPDGLWQMIEENSRSRVFLGVHWVFDGFAVDKNGSSDLGQNVGGVPLGLTIAEDIFDKGTNKKTVNKSNVGPRP